MCVCFSVFIRVQWWMRARVSVCLCVWVYICVYTRVWLCTSTDMCLMLHVYVSLSIRLRCIFYYLKIRTVRPHLYRDFGTAIKWKIEAFFKSKTFSKDHFSGAESSSSLHVVSVQLARKGSSARACICCVRVCVRVWKREREIEEKERDRKWCQNNRELLEPTQW